MAKIKAKEIRFGRSETTEGVSSAEGTSFQGPDAWRKANEWLARRAMLLKKDMPGYLKHEFTVTWEDGNVYSGRYDLYPWEGQVHESMGRFDRLDEHVLAFCMFFAGLKRPPYMTEGKYAAFVSSCPDSSSYKEFLDEYQVGDWCPGESKARPSET